MEGEEVLNLVVMLCVFSVPFVIFLMYKKIRQGGDAVIKSTCCNNKSGH